jgi:hypothetical protein
MAACVGIEVSPDGYRVVELNSRLRPGRGALETRAASFAAVPPAGAQTDATLTSLRGRRANVVLWARTDYRRVLVTDGSSARMLAEARKAARAESTATDGQRTAQIVLGRVDLRTERTLADITPTGVRWQDGRREMLLASATADDVFSQLRPLVKAGVRVGSVLTAAGALHALALARRPLTVPGVLEAYVAIEGSTTCMALVQDGLLLAAGDLSWGFLDAPEFEHHAERLASQLLGFAAIACPPGRSIGQICLCGSPPALRTLAMALMQVLDVEVEPLDSMFAIDTEHLPSPAADFRDQIAQLRLAWAAAGDESPAVDLFRARRAALRTARIPYVTAAAGAAAGLLIGWQAQTWWLPGEPARGRVVRAPALRSLAPPPSPEGASARVERPLPPLPSLGRVDVLDDLQASAAATEGTVPAPAARTAPVDVAAHTTLVAQAAPVNERPPAEPRRPPAAASVTRPTEPRVPQSTEEVALPFDAVLETILWSPERALAIVDGRIVQPGDDIRGARVQRITENAVLLRDVRGRSRRLSLSGVRE